MARAASLSRTWLALWPALQHVTDVAGQERWMEQQWEHLRDRTLLDIVLPGSHNSGNTGDLGSGPRCESDYRYAEYQAMEPGRSHLSQVEFDRRYLPWNVNHDHSLAGQLFHGARFFHLKVCSFAAPGSLRLSLDDVRHQHRGYTTSQTLRGMLTEVSDFLKARPREIVAIGFMNLHWSVQGGGSGADVEALAAAVVAHFRQAGLGMVVGKDLASVTLDNLVAAGRRVAAFFPNRGTPLPPDVIDASLYLREAWDGTMASGDLQASRRWLEQEFVETSAGRFHVLQANPNDAEQNMYDRMDVDGKPKSLRVWLNDFLQDLQSWIGQVAAQNPGHVKINAVSSDFLDTSRTYDIAMRLMGLSGVPPAGELPMSRSSPACLNPAVLSGTFADVSLNRTRYRVRAAHVMQRHCDRWIYQHDDIGNICWPRQQNSSADSSHLAAAECSRMPQVDGALLTAWQSFPKTVDPYASPAAGTCNVDAGGTPQATVQGRDHAYQWGEMLRKQYVPDLVPWSCPQGSLAIYADKVHKNEITVQSEYEAICGRAPSSSEFTAEATLVGYVPGQRKGTPWYIQSAQCGGPDLDQYLQEADQAKKASEWWKGQMQETAAAGASAASKASPPSDLAATITDNLIDCIVVHACTGLADTPSAFLDERGLPGKLFDGMDRDETKSRTWPLSYWKSKGDRQAYLDFAARYYGYFFAVLSDRLRAAVENNPKAPKLSIAVMSDGNLSPILYMYGLEEQARRRPPYLSALVHEVHEDLEGGGFFVRVLFNGKVLRVCPSSSSFPLCPLGEWAAYVAQFVPSREVCAALYEGYDFIAPLPNHDDEGVKPGVSRVGEVSSGELGMWARLLLALAALAACALLAARLARRGGRTVGEAGHGRADRELNSPCPIRAKVGQARNRSRGLNDARLDAQDSDGL